MTEPNELSRRTNPGGSNPAGLMRYRLALEPSPELGKYIGNFLQDAGITRLHVGKSAIKLYLLHNPVKQLSHYSDNRELDASISSYSRVIEYYSQRSRQLRLGADGFEYNQQRTRRGAFTSLTFGLILSPKARADIVRPPFFDDGTEQIPVRANILFPSGRVVPSADQAARELESALEAEHPSAIDGMAQSALYMCNLRVSGSILPSEGVRALRAVKDQN